MNEFTSCAVWADSLLVEGMAFFWFVVGIFHYFLDHFLGSMGELAFMAIAAGLVSLPLPAHFRFILRLINLRFHLLLIGRIKAKTIDLIPFWRSTNHHHFLLFPRILMFITGTHTIRIITHAWFSGVIFSVWVSALFSSSTLVFDLFLELSVDIKRSALVFWVIKRRFGKHFVKVIFGC